MKEVLSTSNYRSRKICSVFTPWQPQSTIHVWAESRAPKTLLEVVQQECVLRKINVQRKNCPQKSEGDKMRMCTGKRMSSRQRREHWHFQTEGKECPEKDRLVGCFWTKTLESAQSQPFVNIFHLRKFWVANKLREKRLSHSRSKQAHTWEEGRNMANVHSKSQQAGAWVHHLTSKAGPTAAHKERGFGESIRPLSL